VRKGLRGIRGEREKAKERKDINGENRNFKGKGEKRVFLKPVA
jgi:hypothetical protein